MTQSSHVLVFWLLLLLSFNFVISDSSVSVTVEEYGIDRPRRESRRRMGLMSGECHEYRSIPTRDRFRNWIRSHRVTCTNTSVIYERWPYTKTCEGEPYQYQSALLGDNGGVYQWRILDREEWARVHCDQGTATHASVSYYRDANASAGTILYGPELVGASLGVCHHSLQGRSQIYDCTPDGSTVVHVAFLDDRCDPLSVTRIVRLATNTYLPARVEEYGYGDLQPAWMSWSCPTTSSEHRARQTEIGEYEVSYQNTPGPLARFYSCDDTGCTRGCAAFEEEKSKIYCSETAQTWISLDIHPIFRIPSFADIISAPYFSHACLYGLLFIRECPRPPVPLSLVLPIEPGRSHHPTVKFPSQSNLATKHSHHIPSIVNILYSDTSCGSESDTGYMNAQAYAPYLCESSDLMNDMNASHCVMYITLIYGVVTAVHHIAPRNDPTKFIISHLEHYPVDRCLSFLDDNNSERWTTTHADWPHPFELDSPNIVHASRSGSDINNMYKRLHPTCTLPRDIPSILFLQL